MAIAGGQAGNQLLDGAGLIAARLVSGHQLKVHAKIIREERRLGEEIKNRELGTGNRESRVCGGGEFCLIVCGEWAEVGCPLESMFSMLDIRSHPM